MKQLSGDEHKVFTVIANTMNMNHCNRIPIKRQVIAEICGWWNEDRPKYSMNKVSKLTASIERKGLIKKDEIFNSDGTSIVFYTIPMLEVSKQVDKNFEKFDETRQKSVAHNKQEIYRNKQSINSNNTNSTNNSNNTNNTNKVDSDSFNPYDDIELKEAESAMVSTSINN